MIGPTGAVRVMVATKAVDFRKGAEELCGKLGCAPKACIISGGRFHPESCRLIW